jgi:hypothetical protein
VLIFCEGQFEQDVKDKIKLQYKNTSIKFVSNIKMWKLWKLKGKIIVCFDGELDLSVKTLEDTTNYPFEDFKLNIVVMGNDVDPKLCCQVYSFGSLVCHQADRLIQNIQARNCLLDAEMLQMIQSDNDVSI